VFKELLLGNAYGRKKELNNACHYSGPQAIKHLVLLSFFLANILPLILKFVHRGLFFASVFCNSHRILHLKITLF